MKMPKLPRQALRLLDCKKQSPRWLRWTWLVCGAVCLATGFVGIVLPLLPTTPFVLLAAFCFSRGSERYEQWLLNHPRFGPMVRDWRANGAVPLRAKQFASGMMFLSSILSCWLLPVHLGWIPGTCCAVVAFWLWRLPTARKHP
jgi:uncharacterized membrane protein YbaN (DUF454 family)